MTVKEFLKALEDIKRTHGYNRFDLYARDEDNSYLQFFIGKYEPDVADAYGEEDTIIPISRNIVELHTTVFDSDLEEVYDTVEKLKKVFAQRKIRDTAVIKLYITGDGVWEPGGYNYEGDFDIIKVVPAKQKNTVVLHVAEFGTTPQLKTYDISYTIWEQNKYSVEIDAYSKEEAEAKFNEMYNDPESRNYDERDAEIVDIRER